MRSAAVSSAGRRAEYPIVTNDRGAVIITPLKSNCQIEIRLLSTSSCSELSSRSSISFRREPSRKMSHTAAAGAGTVAQNRTISGSSLRPQCSTGDIPSTVLVLAS